MCRALAYIGPPLLLDDVLFNPDNSLIKQTFQPRLMDNMLNLAGFGMASWLSTSYDPEKPSIYRTDNLPVYDRNLKNFAEKNHADCFIAHVRGVPFLMELEKVINRHNIHPFVYPGFKVVLAHNGILRQYNNMKADFYRHIKPEILKHLFGTTDSEIIYAMMMSQLKNPYDNPSIEELTDALITTLKLIKKIRIKHKQHDSSSINLFITNGHYLIVTRFAFDYGRSLSGIHSLEFEYPSLWYTCGEYYGQYENEYRMLGDKKQAIMLASEPLTEDITTWMELPEYTLMTAQPRDGLIHLRRFDLDI